MKYIHYVLLAGILAFALASCKQEKYGPYGISSGVPKPITNAVVENLPGAAKITYTLPDNRDLLYVRADYEIDGKQREVKSSLYNNSLIVTGFADTSEYRVVLYAVNRNEEESQPVQVMVKPLEAPIVTIAKSIEYRPDFGGLSFQFENLTEAEVSIHVLTKDSTGEWVPAQNVGGTESVLYTKRKEGVFAVRGFDAELRTFGFFVKDRWDNYSDTIETELVPLAEMELDRSCSDCFKEVKYASDVSYVAGWGVANLFDDKFGDPTYHTVVGTGMPQWFTVSLGKSTTLSRLKIWQRPGNEFNHGNVRRFEVWGSNEPGDNWDRWILLGSFESMRPSGLPVGAKSTAEDLAYSNAGEEFVFPPGTPEVKYLRFKSVESWSRGTFIHIAEMRFWGIQ